MGAGGDVRGVERLSPWSPWNGRKGVRETFASAQLGHGSVLGVGEMTWARLVWREEARGRG